MLKLALMSVVTAAAILASAAAPVFAGDREDHSLQETRAVRDIAILHQSEPDVPAAAGLLTADNPQQAPTASPACGAAGDAAAGCGR